MSGRRLACAAAAVVAAATVSWSPACAAEPSPLPSGDGCLPAPTTTETGVPWAQARLAPERAWELTRGDGVVVGIVDTGVDASTPQMAGRVLRGADLTTAAEDGAADDCFGHGTFIAGIIAAAPADGTGFAGVAPEARILPIRVANAADDGTAALLARGIRAAVDGGARVINISASTTTPEQSLVEAVAYAEAKDVVVVAAAANGADTGTMTAYPAALPTVLAVGAITSTGELATFSQTGPHLRLVAPGVDVASVGPRGPGHWEGSGTSYAVPFVAGTAALVRAYRPHLTAAQVRDRLTATADHPAAAMPDAGVGWGVVNPLAAVSAVLPEEDTPVASLPPMRVPRPDLPPHDAVGPRLTALAAGVTLAGTGLVAVTAVLWPAGRRRGWRPARTVRFRGRVSPRPPAAPRRSASAPAGRHDGG
ncbi:type VII secretion-associated serine protease mycosin [Catenuloplanes atrovinosus]|uniref:Type VII secretion-associated serine protease mycosin n=1 Tax=Catenuloplanes atrovinosus TaxID=137266 RepID=A0AAE3YRE3_9ACTN|nr:type VII secretion-associated serine protease mycosin [Catenuloplanes atrovinosus]MDR7277300.1 type VII secretion-associated serine protease mycosin [Catenuloplanes atrovinosus]